MTGGATRSLSVIIPAHNEATVITRLLLSLTDDPRGREFEIVVVPNGCTDDTAERAAAVSSSIIVSRLDEGSKIAALREGDRVATSFPRAYVDADVQVDAGTLSALADVLSGPGGPLVAAPRFAVDAAGADWLVRCFYRIWELTEYRQTGLIGAGIYALSAEGRARFTDWPEVIADDRFVQQLFFPSERHTLIDHAFTVRSPRNIRALIHREIRIARGNLELPAALQRADRPAAGRHAALIKRVLRRPQRWLDFLVYALITCLVRVLAKRASARGESAAWNRDESTRSINV